MGIYEKLGLVGITIGTCVMIALGVELGEQISTLTIASALSIVTFILVAILTKLATKRRILVFYRHAALVFLTAAIVGWTFDRSILRYLDLAAVGISFCLAFGRLGCSTVGCCYGSPSTLGIRLRRSAQNDRFPRCYDDRRLFPATLVEALCAVTLALSCTIIVYSKGPIGAAMATFVVGYGQSRFFLEFVRGDEGRLSYAGFSEAQWFALITTAGLFVLARKEELCLSVSHTLCTGTIWIVALSLACSQSLRDRFIHPLLGPRHIRELAELIDLLAPEVHTDVMHPDQPIGAGPTSLACFLVVDDVKRKPGKDYEIRLTSFSSCPERTLCQLQKTIRVLLKSRVRH